MSGKASGCCLDTVTPVVCSLEEPFAARGCSHGAHGPGGQLCNPDHATCAAFSNIV